MFKSFLFYTLLIFTVRENSKYTGLWCNGNTTDFDSVIVGSSPTRATNNIYNYE